MLCARPCESLWGNSRRLKKLYALFPSLSWGKKLEGPCWNPGALRSMLLQYSSSVPKFWSLENCRCVCCKRELYIYFSPPTTFVVWLWPWRSFSCVVELFIIECVLVDHLVVVITSFVCLPFFVFFCLAVWGLDVFDRGVRLDVHLSDVRLPVPPYCSIF